VGGESHDLYPVPAGIRRVRATVRGSRFETVVAHAPDAEAAHAFVERIREEHPDATHHCWAFVAGPPGSMASVGMSDDGEPHGTAGRPMLTTLLHGEVGEVVAVSTRWYGGTKLGTGGLARAYGGGVRDALDGLPTRLKTVRTEVTAEVEYRHLDALRHLVGELDVRVVEASYGASVRYRLAVPERRMDEFARRLADASQGKATLA
jgi:uncharacterized YigZ family protein